MAAQRGRDLLLRVDSDGLGTFISVAGLRARRLSFNAETVDATNTDSADQWRELLAGAGVRRAALSGSGIFKDAASDLRVRSLFFDAAIVSWEVVIPDFGTVSGPFQITSLEYAGSHDAELSFEMALESAGLISFAAV